MESKITKKALSVRIDKALRQWTITNFYFISIIFFVWENELLSDVKVIL